MNMEICRLKAGDGVRAIRAVHELKPVEGQNGLDASEDHMRKLLQQDANYLIVAFDGGRPVGFLVAHRFSRIDRDKNMVYLYEIGVDPDYRRQGIGSKMIRLLKDECKGDNVMEIWVATGDDNIPAMRLYESTGAVKIPRNYLEYVYQG